MNQINKITYFHLIGFVLAAMAIYYPTWENGFVTDWMSWIYWYKEGTFSDIVHCFGYPGLHQFFHLIHYSLYLVCGTDHFLWYIPYAMMHGINAFLVMKIVLSAAQLFRVSSSRFIAWSTALVFLISPYQVEPVVWKVCFHYMMSLALIMASWWYLIRYINTEKRSSLIAHHSLFILALLTLEISLAAPFIFAIFNVLYLYRFDSFRAKTGLLLHTFGIQCALIVLYFIANKVILGAWVGHYGAEQHLRFDPILIGGNGLKYLWKYLFFAHYWSYHEKMALYDAFDSNLLNIGMIISLLVALAGLLIYKLKNLRSELSIAVFGLIAFFMGIFPIANLFFMRIHPYENDRYGYFASIFFYLFVVSIVAILPKKIRLCIISLYLGIHAYLLYGMLITASNAGHIHRELVRSFDYYDREDIVFLTKPDNYNGMCLFRDLSGKALAFRESLDLFEGRRYSGSMTDVAQLNMVSPNDGVRVAQIDSLTIQVAIRSGGTWFWHSGFGLTPYKTDEYEVTKAEWHYRVHFYEDPSEKTFLYFEGDQWREFKFE